MDRMNKYYDYIDKLINDTPDFMIISDDEIYVLLDRLVVDLSENAMPWLFKVYLENNYNRLPIGSERIHTRSSNNKKTIFIRYRNIPITKDSLSDKELNWMPKTRWVWEQYNGPIPDNHCIIQLDGDYTNCSIENLRCINKNILAKINRMCGLGIITDAMIEILKLEEDLDEANRKR